MNEFSDQVVLVTGAGRGLGRAIALAFARRGATLALNDLTPVNLDETLRQARALGARAKDYIFDVAKRMPVEEMVSEVLQDFGRIDVLVNNAGVHPRLALLDMDEWDLRRTLDVNLSGAFFTTQLVGRAMRAQSEGVILNIACSRDQSGEPGGSAAFIASKQGLIGLTRAAASELAPYHIRVNALCPVRSAPGGSPPAGQGQDLAPDSPAATVPGQTDLGLEAAERAVFLCSQAAAHLTGQAFDLGDRLVNP